MGILQLAKDKKLHLAAGLLVGIFAAIIAGLAGWAIPASIGAGLAKEFIYDAGLNFVARHTGRPETHDVDPEDALATALGGVVAFILCIPFV